MPAMAPLTGLTKAWTEAEGSKPARYSIRGVARGPREVDPQIHGTSWVAWAKPDEHLPDLPPIVEGQGDYPEQAMLNLATRLRELKAEIGR
jgi:hypothetical protein